MTIDSNPLMLKAAIRTGESATLRVARWDLAPATSAAPQRSVCTSVLADSTTLVCPSTSLVSIGEDGKSVVRLTLVIQSY